MPLKDHSTLSGIDNHSPIAFVYASQIERESAVGFLPADIYKVAVQKDEYSFWVLISTFPLLWKRI